jgi:hypothetical protein
MGGDHELGLLVVDVVASPLGDDMLSLGDERGDLLVRLAVGLTLPPAIPLISLAPSQSKRMSQVVASYETVWPSGWNACAMKGTNSAKPGPATLLWNVPRHALSEGRGGWAEAAADSPSERRSASVTTLSRFFIVTPSLEVVEGGLSHLSVDAQAPRRFPRT